MSEMVERVARRLTENHIRTANELFKISDPRRVRTEEQIIASVEAGWRMNEKDARAAIEAMREPTDAMLKGGGSYIARMVGDPYNSWNHFTGEAKQAYTAMISAALSND